VDYLLIAKMTADEMTKILSSQKHNVGSYWLAKEWIATAVCLKWMRNAAHYIENLFHSSIYWFSSSDSSRFIWGSRSSFVTRIFFFWSSHLRSSLSLRSDLIRIAYSSSNSLIFRRFRKSINLKEIISIEWL
jgi:hypothetical protein